ALPVPASASQDVRNDGRPEVIASGCNSIATERCANPSAEPIAVIDWHSGDDSTRGFPRLSWSGRRGALRKNENEPGRANHPHHRARATTLSRALSPARVSTEARPSKRQTRPWLRGSPDQSRPTAQPGDA